MKKSSRKILFDKAWSVFRKFIISRDNGLCITCGRRGNQAGHFIHGKNKTTYFDEYNVHCQCMKCNFFLDGNRDIYLRKIQLKYGIKKGDELLSRRFEVKYWTKKELEDIIKKYQ